MQLSEGHAQASQGIVAKVSAELMASKSRKPYKG